MKASSIFSLKTLELVLRSFTAVYMLNYGFVKFGGRQFAYGKQFYESSISDLSGFDFMWAFFSYSVVFGTLIGIIQIIGGILLFFNRTKLFGVVILFPILTTIFLIDFFYGLPFILQAFINVSFYMLVLLLICFNERKRIAKAASAFYIVSKTPFDFKAIFYDATIIGIGFILTYLILNEGIKKMIFNITYESKLFH